MYHTKCDRYALLQSLGVSLFGSFRVHPVFVVRAVYDKIQRCISHLGLASLTASTFHVGKTNAMTSKLATKSTKRTDETLSSIRTFAPDQLSRVLSDGHSRGPEN